MTRAEALAMIRLLSAIESHMMTSRAHLPDYLIDQLSEAMAQLEKIVLGENDDR